VMSVTIRAAFDAGAPRLALFDVRLPQHLTQTNGARTEYFGGHFGQPDWCYAK